MKKGKEKEEKKKKQIKREKRCWRKEIKWKKDNKERKQKRMKKGKKRGIWCQGPTIASSIPCTAPLHSGQEMLTPMKHLFYLFY